MTSVKPINISMVRFEQSISLETSLLLSRFLSLVSSPSYTSRCLSISCHSQQKKDIKTPILRAKPCRHPRSDRKHLSTTCTVSFITSFKFQALPVEHSRYASMGTRLVVLLLFAIRSMDCQPADDTTQCNPKDLTSHQLDQMNAREQEALVNN